MSEVVRKEVSFPADSMECIRYIISGSVGDEVKYWYEYNAFKKKDEKNWTIHKKNGLTGEISEVILHQDFLDFLIAEAARDSLEK